MRPSTQWVFVFAGILGVAVGCSSGRHLYVGKEGIGFSVERDFSISNGCITVDSPFDLVLRSPEYGRRADAKNAFDARAKVVYDLETSVATTNWSCGAGVHVTKPWRGLRLSGGASFRGDNAALTCVDYYKLDNDWKMSVRECAKMAKEVAEEIEARFDVAMKLKGLDSEETLIGEAEKPLAESDSHGERDFLRYCGKNGEGAFANEYVVVGHVNSNHMCRVSFAYAVAGELRRCYAPTDGDRKWEEACAYRDGKHRREKNLAKSRALFLEAGELHAKGNHVIDMWRTAWIGEWYERGEAPFSKDDREALKWYGLAAGMGSSDCMRKIASFYEEGKGGVKDVKAAEHWRNRADEEELMHRPLDGECPRPRYGKVGSFADLRIGATDISANNRQFLQSSCVVGFEWEELKKFWSHSMSVLLEQPWHGFDAAELSFNESDLSLEKYSLAIRRPTRRLTEEECVKEVDAIANELAARMGVNMELQPMPDKKSRYWGRLIRWYHGIKGEVHYSLTAEKNQDGHCEIQVYVARNSWTVYQ